MAIPDPVYLVEYRSDIELRPLRCYTIVLTHFDGTVEVNVSDANNNRRPYKHAIYAYYAALRFKETGCYASVVIAPCRTTLDIPNAKAYEEAQEMNLVLAEPDKWVRRHSVWRRVQSAC